jgi:hypothetical protein
VWGCRKLSRRLTRIWDLSYIRHRQMLLIWRIKVHWCSYSTYMNRRDWLCHAHWDIIARGHYSHGLERWDHNTNSISNHWLSMNSDRIYGQCAIAESLISYEVVLRLWLSRRLRLLSRPTLRSMPTLCSWPTLCRWLRLRIFIHWRRGVILRVHRLNISIIDLLLFFIGCLFL